MFDWFKPPTPGVTGISTDRFIANEWIESTHLVKNADGQTTHDMRATWGPGTIKVWNIPPIDPLKTVEIQPE